MERDGEGELNSREEKRCHIHCNSPALSRRNNWMSFALKADRGK
jgi:hypothetical protein